MAKPAWSIAPKWAKYRAQDMDGDWFWFSHAPKRASKTKKHWCVSIGKVEFAQSGIDNGKWHQTLEARK